MATQIEHIDVPAAWESTNDWDSHRPALYLALINTKGDVVEIGIGFGSTPLVNSLCRENRRCCVAYENNMEWFDKLCIDGNIATYVEDYLKLSIRKSDLFFIDCAPGEIRKELIAKYANVAQIIVVHDTEPGADYVYGMATILNSFKYRLDYTPEGKPWTTIVSNFINVEEWIQKGV